MSIWPQPVVNELNFSIPGISQAEYFVTDLTGKIILQGTINQNDGKINVSNFYQGMYILSIKAENKTYVNWFIKE
jgi:hypothetical protein